MDMNNGWQSAPLGEICDVVIGRTPARQTPKYWGGANPWLSISDMSQGKFISRTKEMITDAGVKECNCRLIEKGTLLLSFKLSIGKVGFASIPLYTNEAIAALPIKKRDLVIKDYLYWALQHIDFDRYVDKAAKGKTLNTAKLREIVIPLPALKEQERIAQVLDGAAALREKRQQTIAALEMLLGSIFVEMFGDPETNPRGWMSVPFESLLSIPLRNGQSPSTKGKYQGRVLTLSAITQGKYTSAAVKEAFFDSEITSDKSVNTLDFLICRGNGNLKLVGQGKFPLEDLPETFFPDTMIAARIDRSKVSPQFLETVWSFQAVRRQIEKGARTTNGTYKINQQLLDSIRVITPPLPLQNKFALVANAINNCKSKQIQSLMFLKDLFASLQQRAFGGANSLPLMNSIPPNVDVISHV